MNFFEILQNHVEYIGEHVFVPILVILAIIVGFLLSLALAWFLLFRVYCIFSGVWNWLKDQ